MKQVKITYPRNVRIAMKTLCLIIIILIHSIVSLAQEMMGITGSNYAGTNALPLNPGSIATYPLKWEVNILTIDVFFDNNYAYIPKTSLISLFRKMGQDGNFEMNESSFTYTGDKLKNKSAYVNLKVQVPSVLFSIRENKLAVHAAVRTIVSANRIHVTMPKLLQGSATLEFNNQNLEIPKFRVNGLGWSEFGFSYGRPFYKAPDFNIYGGISIKRLHGYLGGYLLNRSIEFKLEENIQQISTEIDAEFGFIDPSNAAPSYRGFLSGKGMGIDIGVVFEQKDLHYKKTFHIHHEVSEQEKKLNYAWRVGVSLIDIGRIRFTQNTQTYKIDEVIVNDTIQDLDFLINSQLYKPPNIINSLGFNMQLPTAFCLQVDYKIVRNVFVHGTWVQRIVFGGPGIDRANVISLTPRFELKWFEFDIPFLLYQYRYPRFGTALRIGPLSIGSDKIGSILIPGRFSGTDIYISLKIQPGRKKEKMNDLPCPFSPYKNIKHSLKRIITKVF